MQSSTMRRGLTVVSSLSLCALLAGCDRAGGAREESLAPGADPQAADAAVPLAESEWGTAADANTVAVTFQLTGLMLIVPPGQSGGEMNVILPKVTHGPAHEARLAFGGNRTELCKEYNAKARICFVDLATWSLAGIGAGGAPADMRNVSFPRGVLNVTRSSGNEHKVKLPEVRDSVVASLTFLSGRPQEEACRLARWHFKPVGHNKDSVSLVNSLDWRIYHPARQDFVLRFTRAGLDSPVSVTLTPTQFRRIGVFVAHVPADEMKAITSGTAMQAGALETSIPHFRNFYKLLRKQGSDTGPDESRRPIPELDRTLDPECAVTITSEKFGQKSSGLYPLPGVKTYACVVGTGDT